MASSPSTISDTEMSPPPLGHYQNTLARTYETSYTTEIGELESHEHKLRYQVTSRFESKVQALEKSKRFGSCWPQYQTPKQTLDALPRDDYSSRHYFITNLAALAYRLTRTLVATCDHPISSSDMCPHWVVPSLYAASTSNPLLILPLEEKCFTALAAAAYLEGAEVVSSREMPLYDIPAEELPEALFNALRVVELNMGIAKQSTAFALALTMGVHAGLSVVGHSPEGEAMGEILRSIPLGTPCGAILNRFQAYPPTCIPLRLNMKQAYLDRLALVTAAAWAHCDPAPLRGRSWSPTVSLYILRAADDLPPPGSWASKHPNIVAALDRAMKLYWRALQKIFGLGSEPLNKFLSISVVATNFCDLNQYFDQHIIAPFYWIEPTTILPRKLIGSLAEVAGSASLCDPGKGFETSLFDSLDECQVFAPNVQSGWVASFKSPRNCGFVLHYNNTQYRPLSQMIPSKMTLSKIVLPGGGHSLRALIKAGEGLDKYLWSHDSICAPSELYNHSGKIGFMLKHAQISGKHAFKTQILAYNAVRKNPMMTFRAGALNPSMNIEPICYPSLIGRGPVVETKGSWGLDFIQYQKSAKSTQYFTLPCEINGGFIHKNGQSSVTEPLSCPWCGLGHCPHTTTCAPVYALEE